MGAEGGLEPCTGSAGEEAGGGAGQEAQTRLGAENSPGCSRPGTPQPPTRVPGSEREARPRFPPGASNAGRGSVAPGNRQAPCPCQARPGAPLQGRPSSCYGWRPGWDAPRSFPAPAGAPRPPGRPACPNTGRARLHPAPTGMTALGRKGHPGFARAVCTPVCLAHARAERHLLVRRAPGLPLTLPWPQGAGRSTRWHLIPALPPAPALRTEAAKGTREAQPPGLVHTPTRHGPCRVRRGHSRVARPPGRKGLLTPMGPFDSGGESL